MMLKKIQSISLWKYIINIIMKLKEKEMVE
jgi:hypothetical protein